MSRNRQQTSLRIKQAAVRLLERDGFAGWGINAIAREAKTDKVLIYRYFESLEGLLNEIVSETQFWPEPDRLDDSSAEDYINGTIQFMKKNSISRIVAGIPESNPMYDSLKNKFSQDLESWLKELRENCNGYITDSQLMRLPALIHFQITESTSLLTVDELWKQVSPPLEWISTQHFEYFEDLPPELL